MITNAHQHSLAEPLASGVAQILRGKSIDMLEAFPDEALDWVYIDTDYSFHSTFAELKIAASKVKAQGIIAGHDFCTGNVVTPVPYGVVEACAKFVVDFDWSYRYITLESDGHFSFALQKTA